MPFEQHSDGSVVASLTEPESALITSLAGQIAAMLDELASPPSISDPDAAALYESVGIGGSRALPADPAVARLLPNAYADDESSGEFRALTERSLASRKIANARVVVASLDRTGPEVRLTPSDVQAWLRTLTDIRLTIAVRLGITTDDDDVLEDDTDESLALRDIYDWLGWVTESLVEAIDS